MVLAGVLAAVLGGCAGAVPDAAIDQAARAELARRPDYYSNGEARAFLVLRGARPVGLLWGTFHTAYASETVMPRPIRAKFEEAADLSVEFAMDRISRPRMRGLMQGVVADITTPSPAEMAALDPQTRQTIDAVDVPGELRAKLSLRGWAGAIAAAAMRTDAGAMPQVGFVDLNLMGFARSRQIPVYSLEEPEAQLAALRVEPNGAEALTDLRRVVRQRERLKALRAWSLAAYGQGQVGMLIAGAGGFMTEPSDLALIDARRQTWLANRNRAWIPVIERILARPGLHFIAFGAGHLVGSDGVVALLREQGFTVVPCPGDICPAEA